MYHRHRPKEEHNLDSTYAKCLAGCVAREGFFRPNEQAHSIVELIRLILGGAQSMNVRSWPPLELDRLQFATGRVLNWRPDAAVDQDMSKLNGRNRGKSCNV